MDFDKLTLWDKLAIGARLAQNHDKIGRVVELSKPLIAKAKPAFEYFMEVWPELERLLKEIAVLINPEWQAKLMQDREGGLAIDAKWIQQSLTDLGFDTKGVDNQIGPDTLKAIAAYQKARGLEADRWIGPQTLEALGRDMAAMHAKKGKSG